MSVGLPGLAYWEEEGPGIHRLGLAAQVRLAPHEVSGATEAATVYEIVAGAQGRVCMVAQDRRHSLGWPSQIGGDPLVVGRGAEGGTI